MDEDAVEAEFPGESPEERAEWLELCSLGFTVIGHDELAPRADDVVAWLQSARTLSEQVGTRGPMKPFAFPSGVIETVQFADTPGGWAALTDGFRTRALGGVGVSYYTNIAQVNDAGPDHSPWPGTDALVSFGRQAFARWLRGQPEDADPTPALVRLFLDAADLAQATLGLFEWTPTRDPRFRPDGPDLFFPLDWDRLVPYAAWGLLLGAAHIDALRAAGREIEAARCAVIASRDGGGAYLQLTASLREWSDEAFFALRDFLAPIVPPA